MKLRVCAQTNTGKKRLKNEDNLCVNGTYLAPALDTVHEIRERCKEGLFSVCDGMGGEEFGDFASMCAVSILAQQHREILNAPQDTQPGLVDGCIREINNQVCVQIKKEDVRIGSTLALLCITGESADVYNIGDSRVYCFRDGNLRRLSHDHTLAQQKVDMGILTQEEAEHEPDRHKLTQHLGIFEEEMLIQAHHTRETVQAGDVFLLCSDGLSDMVHEAEISRILYEAGNCNSAADALISAANAAGGKDNITVIVVCCK